MEFSNYLDEKIIQELAEYSKRELKLKLKLKHKKLFMEIKC